MTMLQEIRSRLTVDGTPDGPLSKTKRNLALTAGVALVVAVAASIGLWCGLILSIPPAIKIAVIILGSVIGLAILILFPKKAVRDSEEAFIGQVVDTEEEVVVSPEVERLIRRAQIAGQVDRCLKTILPNGNVNAKSRQQMIDDFYNQIPSGPGPFCFSLEIIGETV